MGNIKDRGCSTHFHTIPDGKTRTPKAACLQDTVSLQTLPKRSHVTLRPSPCKVALSALFVLGSSSQDLLTFLPCLSSTVDASPVFFVGATSGSYFRIASAWPPSSSPFTALSFPVGKTCTPMALMGSSSVPVSSVPFTHQAIRFRLCPSLPKPGSSPKRQNEWPLSKIYPVSKLLPTVPFMTTSWTERLVLKSLGTSVLQARDLFAFFLIQLLCT